jgi:hypothetical protein
MKLSASFVQASSFSECWAPFQGWKLGQWHFRAFFSVFFYIEPWRCFWWTAGALVLNSWTAEQGKLIVSLCCSCCCCWRSDWYVCCDLWIMLAQLASTSRYPVLIPILLGIIFFYQAYRLVYCWISLQNFFSALKAFAYCDFTHHNLLPFMNVRRRTTIRMSSSWIVFQNCVALLPIN